MTPEVPPARQPEARVGATQTRRALPALDPAQVPVDERDLSLRLAFAPQYARLLAFYDLSGETSRDWTGFFRQDESFLLAEMRAAYTLGEFFDSVALERRLREGRGGRELEREAVVHIHDLAARINDWYARAASTLQAQRGDSSLRETLAAVIQRDLGKYWTALTDEATWRRFWNDCPAVDFDTKVWEVQEALPPEEGSERLITILNAFHRATKKLGELAQARLPGSLAAPDHPPHTALYVGLALLLEEVRAELNRFAERHLEYYYRKVLSLRERDGEPDVAHLYFELAPHAPEHLLEAGTRLRGGKDANGQDVLYATEQDLALNTARVAALKTLYVEHATDARSQRTGYITRILARPVADSQDGRGAPLQQPQAGWPTLGGTAPGPIPPEAAGPDAELGLLIASSLLELKEGQREITLTFKFDPEPETEASFQQVLAQYLEALGRSGDAAPARDGTNESGIELPAEACLLQVSSAKGWLALDAFQLRCDRAAATIELQFRLQASDPPLLWSPAASAAAGVATQRPMIRLLLNPRARVYAYSFFRQLVLAEVCIRVKVTGLRDLHMHSSLGPIQSGQPFAPFGVTPAQGAYLLMANPELSAKRLEYVALSIEWQSVPRSFAAYYRAYGRDIDETTFKGRLYLHSGGRWLEDRFPLFRNQGLASTTLDLTRAGQPIATAAASEQPRAAQLIDTTPAGVLRLELAEPDFAFGHDLYPRIVAEAALARTAAVLREAMQRQRPGSAEQPAGKPGEEHRSAGAQSDYVKVSLELADWALPAAGHQEGGIGEEGAGAGEAAGAGGETGPGGPGGMEELPNPPFVPWVKGLSIDYIASDCLSLGGGLAAAAPGAEAVQLFHLFPFGHRAWQPGERTFFPRFEAEGYLYIGLAEVNPAQEVALLFDLRETAAFQQFMARRPSAERVRDGLKWRYLAGGRWQDFPQEGLIADSTQQLTRSGIVKLLIPADSTDDDPILPGGLRWIQVAAAKNAACYPNTAGIHAQAVRARRVTSMPGDLTGAALPPETITELVEKVAAIKAVHQPFATTGGRPKEGATGFRTRVSERLRHKQRAIQPFDYERLVLDAFPQIGQVKCLTWNNTREYGAERIAPGKVVIAVVPTAAAAGASNEPRAPYATLMAVRDHLRQLASPFVREIAVVNPLYERVTLKARVRFVPGKEPGPGLLELKEAISGFVAPWCRHPRVPVRLSEGLGSVRAISHFIEDIDYVQEARVESISVTRDTAPPRYFVADSDEVRGSQPWSVLLPAELHDIGMLAPGEPAGAAAPAAPGRAGEAEAGRRYFLVIPFESMHRLHGGA